MHVCVTDPRVCHLLPCHLRVSTCSLPQQLPDAQVKLILQVEAGKRFAAGSNRPPLHLCSQETFEADLTAFLVSRGDEQLAALVRDKRITW